MDHPQARFSLLEEVERRQDEVIAQLDELNARVESILAEWTRGEPRVVPEQAPESFSSRRSVRAA